MRSLTFRGGRQHHRPIQAEERFSGDYYDKEATLEWIIQAVSQLLVGPGQLVRDALTAFATWGRFDRRPVETMHHPKIPRPFAVGFWVRKPGTDWQAGRRNSWTL